MKKLVLEALKKELALHGREMSEYDLEAAVDYIIEANEMMEEGYTVEQYVEETSLNYPELFQM